MRDDGSVDAATTVAVLLVVGALGLVAAIPFEVVSFGLALFGSVAASVLLVQFRKAIRQLNTSVEDLKSRMPQE